MHSSINNKLYEYFKKRLGSYEYTKGWIKSQCPSPTCDSPNFGIHLGMRRSNCFKCGYHKRPLDIVMDLEGIQTYNEVMAVLNSLEGITYKEPKLDPYELKSDVSLPESYTNISLGDSNMAKLAREYLRGRGFKISELAKAGWGYCTRGDYFGYIIMPFYTNNRLVYFNARRFAGPGTRFNNPKIDDFGIGKSMIIYNFDALYRHNIVFMVESVMNAATIGDKALAMGGKKLSHYQVNHIIKSPVKGVVIGLDDDAIMESIKLALQLVDFKKVKIMQFPKEKDINDLGRKESLKIYRKCRWLSRQDILKLKHDFENYEAT